MTDRILHICRGAIDCALFGTRPGFGRDESRPYIKIFLALLIGATLIGCAGDYTEDDFLDGMAENTCKKMKECDPIQFAKYYTSVKNCLPTERAALEEPVCPHDYVIDPEGAPGYIACLEKLDCIAWITHTGCETEEGYICMYEEPKPHKVPDVTPPECYNILDCDNGETCVNGKCV